MKKIIWFVVLWVASVLVLGIIAMAIRTVLL
jgi:hypothetical protein